MGSKLRPNDKLRRLGYLKTQGGPGSRAGTTGCRIQDQHRDHHKYLVDLQTHPSLKLDVNGTTGGRLPNFWGASSRRVSGVAPLVWGFSMGIVSMGPCCSW